jgi:hypothetical protein
LHWLKKWNELSTAYLSHNSNRVNIILMKENDLIEDKEKKEQKNGQV